MQLFLYAGHLIIFADWLRLISPKGALYVLISVLATLVVARNRSQIIPGLLVLTCLADCDPWNG
ncbi:MAG TPA: hypothetical protein VFN35_31800 [Ktedonobacteraceae bacterium]|nr:hypothetical protein [Ktedonobacteraceae bacterium]